MQRLTIIVPYYKRLTIIVPYYNRPEALKRFQESTKHLSKDFFDIIISEVPTESSGKFNTAKAFNQGVEKAQTEWVMKNDVDCIAEKPELYQWVHAQIQKMNTRNFMILGAKYLNPDGSLRGSNHCGNEVVCTKTAWKVVGKVPEYTGYGFEDYVFEYKLMKNLNPTLQIPFLKKPREVSNYFRDNLLKPENNKYPYWFLHYYHKPIFLPEMVQINLKNMHDDIMRMEGYIQ